MGRCVEIRLAERKIEAEWPVHGLLTHLHLDNAKEFRSEALRRGCEQYGIAIDYRPVRTPHYGGHIERLIGTGGFARVYAITDRPNTASVAVMERLGMQFDRAFVQDGRDGVRYLLERSAFQPLGEPYTVHAA